MLLDSPVCQLAKIPDYTHHAGASPTFRLELCRHPQVIPDRMSEQHDVLLITGIPGTGKTTYGNTFAKEFGFLHRDLEDRRLSSICLPIPPNSSESC